MSRHAASFIAVREFIVEFEVYNLAFRERKRIFTELIIRFEFHPVTIVSLKRLPPLESNHLKQWTVIDVQ